MKINYMFLFLLIIAWPLYYLYQHQLGAISFLVLATYFFFITMKELKALKKENKQDDTKPKHRKKRAKQ